MYPHGLKAICYRCYHAEASPVNMLIFSAIWLMILQILLGLPFLLSHPAAYISRAFNLGRIFIHFWYSSFNFLCSNSSLLSTFICLVLI